MTFLIDENLSRRLKRLLQSEFGTCVHVSDVGLLRSDDQLVWRKARELGLTLLSKDDDLREMVADRGPPPKLVWLRLGNCSTQEIAAALLSTRPEVDAFLKSEAGIYIVGP